MIRALAGRRRYADEQLTKSVACRMEVRGASVQSCTSPCMTNAVGAEDVCLTVSQGANWSRILRDSELDSCTRSSPIEPHFQKQPTAPQIERAMEQIESWENFHVFRVARLLHGHVLAAVVFYSLECHDLIAKLDIPDERLFNFLTVRALSAMMMLPVAARTVPLLVLQFEYVRCLSELRLCRRPPAQGPTRRAGARVSIPVEPVPQRDARSRRDAECRVHAGV